MKILFIGYGHVGSAVGSIFNDDEKVIIDPKINDIKIIDLSEQKFDAIIISVDTPKNQNGSIMNTVLLDVYYHINRYNKNIPILIKSTINPYFIKGWESTYPDLNIVFSPEYLSGKNNIEDFKKQKFMIFGGNQDSACKFFADLFMSKHGNLEKCYTTDLMTSILIKYAENAFLATKVTFMNEMYKIHSELECGTDFKDFAFMLGEDERIGHSHTQVPGWDGKFGWGGHCLDKDVTELVTFSKSNFFKSLIEINKQHRNGADTST